MSQPGSSNILVQDLHDDIEDLHKRLVLKAMTQNVPKDYHKAVTSQPHRKLPRNKFWTWRRYLDKLSSLCDFGKAGSTVVGSIARATVSGTILTLATNCSEDWKRDTMLEHLRFLLRELAQPVKALDERIEKIAHKSIELSREKLEDYTKQLKRELKRIERESSPTATPKGHELLSSVQESLDKAGNDPHRLCSTAAEVLCRPDFVHLKEFTGSRYMNVRHHLGRLRSWHVAARHIVRFYQTFSKQIEGARVELLSRDIFHATQPVTLAANGDDVLLWILGKHKEHFLPALKGALDFASGFLKKNCNTNHHTIIHAEAALAQWAYLENIEFIFGDRYIGCSKPSCYACDMYLSKHPGNFVQRPRHGNAWFKWSPPRLKAHDDDRMTSGILRRMARDIQDDLDATLEGRDLGKRQPFESTSGIETTIRRLHEVLTISGRS